MSSRLIAPKVGSRLATISASFTGSLSFTSMSKQSMLANFLKRTALPSITGLPASAPMLPRPSTAVPFETTATRFALGGVARRRLRVGLDLEAGLGDARASRRGERSRWFAIGLVARISSFPGFGRDSRAPPASVRRTSGFPPVTPGLATRRACPTLAACRSGRQHGRRGAGIGPWGDSWRWGVCPVCSIRRGRGRCARGAAASCDVVSCSRLRSLWRRKPRRSSGHGVAIDTLTPLQAFAGGSARALAGLVEVLARAKEAGLTTDELRPLFAAVDWSEALKG